MMHHRPGTADTTEYWVATVHGGPPEILRVRPHPDGALVDFFAEPSRPLVSDFVTENVKFLGSLALA